MLLEVQSLMHCVCGGGFIPIAHPKVTENLFEELDPGGGLLCFLVSLRGVLLCRAGKEGLYDGMPLYCEDDFFIDNGRCGLSVRYLAGVTRCCSFGE